MDVEISLSYLNCHLVRVMECMMVSTIHQHYDTHIVTNIVEYYYVLIESNCKTEDESRCGDILKEERWNRCGNSLERTWYDTPE